jgi:antitoxin Phd
VTKRGTEAAVLVPAVQSRRLRAAGKPLLKELLLSDVAPTEFLVPARGAARRRGVVPIR